MRKFTLFLVCILASYCHAAPITVRQAQRLAQQFMGVTVSASKLKTLTSPLSLSYQAPDHLFYVFNQAQSQGYVIVSGDDKAAPIIGYSDHGSFDYDKIPESLRQWLKDYERQISYATQNDCKYTVGEDANNWPAIAPLLKTTWGQMEPYNRLCPEKRGEKCLTGCVATAMAQVMSYFRYPKEVNGMAYRNQVDLTGDVIDWDNILDHYTNLDASPVEATEAQKDAVALLMRDAGYSVDMQYDPTISGSYCYNIPFALHYNFGYDAAVHFEARDCYDDETWAKMLYENLATYGPLPYEGYSGIPGHEFVCDGYDGKGYFHFNFGWNGVSDGYFLLSALNPKVPSSGEVWKLYEKHGAVFGIRKPVAGSKPVCRVMFYDIPPMIVKDMLEAQLLLHTTEPTQFDLGFKVKNLATDEISYVVITQKKCTKTVISAGYPLISKIAEGEYVVTPAFRANGEDWQEILLPKGMLGSFHLSSKDGVLHYYVDVPFEYTKGNQGLDAQMIMKNFKMPLACTIKTNGGNHWLDLHGEIVDEQTHEVVAKGDPVSQRLGAECRICGRSFTYVIPVGDIDLQHTYSIVTYDGDKVIGRQTGKKAADVPVLQVITPLSSSEVKDGKIWIDAEGPNVKVQVRSLTGQTVKNAKLYMSINHSETPFELPMDDMKITTDGDVVTIEGHSLNPVGDFTNENDVVELSLWVLGENDLKFVTADGKDIKLEATVVKDDPTSGLGHVIKDSGEMVSAQIYTLEGRCLGQYEPSSWASQLPDGLYVVRYTYTDGTTRYLKVLSNNRTQTK